MPSCLECSTIGSCSSCKSPLYLKYDNTACTDNCTNMIGYYNDLSEGTNKYKCKLCSESIDPQCYDCNEKHIC